jgi:outer membrane protein insertion porin family
MLSAVWRWSWLCAAFLACAHAQAPPPPPRADGPPKDARPRVVFGRTVRIHFPGVKEVSEDELRSIVWIDKDASPSGDPASDAPRSILERDMLLLAAGYYDRGYIMVKIGEPVVTEAQNEPFVDITVKIDEGPRMRIRNIKVFEGSVDMRMHISVPDGAWFARDVLVRELAALRTHYRNQGYANVEAEPETEIDPVTKTVDIRVPIKRGPLVKIERIDVVGNVKTAKAAILERVLLAPGDLFHETKLEQSKERVMAMGAFERIDVSTWKGSSDSSMVVRIDVAEKQR